MLFFLAKFLFSFLLVFAVFWLLFIFVARSVIWVVCRIVGASVAFQLGGLKCLRDIVVKLKKGPIESVTVREVKLSLRQSLLKIGAGILSRDPKLQILICQLEIVMRASSGSSNKPKPRKSRSSGSGKGKSKGKKLMIVANIARFLSVSIDGLAVKTPKATLEIHDLDVEISKESGSKSNLCFKLQVFPIIVLLPDARFSCNGNEGCISSSQTSMGNSPAPFNCKEFLVSCEFGPDRETGMSIKNVDIHIGRVTVNLNETMLPKGKSSSSSAASSQTDVVPAVDPAAAAAKKQNKKQAAMLALSKSTPMIPDKVAFGLTRIDVQFVHKEHGLFMENNITGFQIRCTKSRTTEDVKDSTRVDIQVEFNEIHLLRESRTSIVEILKLDIVSLLYIPVEPTFPVRAEVNVKLGRTQFIIAMNRLKPWLQLHLSKKKKKMVLQEGTAKSEKPTVKPSSEPNIITWSVTFAAPEMTLILYSLDDIPLYHACSKSLCVSANNLLNMGTTMHTELGGLYLYLEDEYKKGLKENLTGVDTNSGSILHVSKVSTDLGKKEVEGTEDIASKSKLALTVGVNSVGISLTFKHIESFISTALSFQALAKNLLGPKKKAVPSQGNRESSSGKPSSGKGVRVIKFNLEQCCVNISGEAGLEDLTVADPKRVNYGSQGGRFVISESADGTPRTASVLSTLSEECKKFNFSTSLDISHLMVTLNKDKQSTHMEIRKVRSIYQDYLLEHRSSLKVTLLDVQNAKFVRRASGHKDCSLFSSTDIAVRWEPDLHLSLIELGLGVKSLLQSKKLQQPSDPNLQDVSPVTDVDQNKDMTKDSKSKKKEVIFAVDIEMLTVSAEAGDGVDALIQVQSIFSENAKIGVLVEGLILIINGARVVKSSRMQVSRIPRTSTSDAQLQGITTWDYVIQGLDIHIYLPFRLELRAIDDAFEDMMRALKLIVAAKTKLFLPSKTESTKPKKPSTTKLGCIKICVRKLTADIEEEPLQGWLDEHYNLLKYEVCEVNARLKYLDDLSKRNANNGNTDTNDGNSKEKKLLHDGFEIDFQDPSSIAKVQEEIHKQSFRAYFQACQNIRPSEGSGACSKGFQSGFKLSSSRTSVFSISATELDLTLTTIEGGEDGMIEIVGKLDPAAREYSIPFARFYGCNILLRAGSLAAHIRDYTYPLFSATLGKCEGCIVLAQQATYFQPQVYQDVYVGRWRKVKLLRSATGTTPAMKTYLDLPIYFQKAEVSYGVGYEAAFADISYAFTVALRRAYLSVRNPDPNWAPPPKKEKSLPWWDDMRQYIHGNISLFFNETRWYIFGTSDPYEKVEHLQVVSGHMEIQQSDGRVYLAAKDFKIFISSLENLAKNRSLKLPIGVSDAFLETPEFIVEVLMDWGCESGTPLNHYLFALPNEGKTREIVFDPYRSTALAMKWDISIKSVTISSVGDGDTVSKSVNSKDFWSNSPTFKIAPHDLRWLQKFAVMQYLPPNKIRFFSRWPRFGCPRILRSGNLSLDRVITEFMLRLDITPICIKHVALLDDDDAKGLTFRTTKVKCEMYQSRGKREFTFDCIRPPLELVYLGLEIHLLKAFLDKSSEIQSIMSKIGQTSKSTLQSASMNRVPSEKAKLISSCTEKSRDDGFFLSSDYFTIRKQAPKADPGTLLAWQEAGKKNIEMNYVRSEFENGSGSDGNRVSDQSDDEGYNVVIADNCQRIFVYGLKILWSIENRDAVMSWVGGLGKAFEPSKPSPSKLYAQAQKKLQQETEAQSGDEVPQNDTSSAPPALNPDPSSTSISVQNDMSSSPPPANTDSNSSSTDQQTESSGVSSSTTDPIKTENLASAVIIAKNAIPDPEEEGTRHFMVNIIEPQFNLHSEDANGRFLLAAASGRVLARSFHSVLQVGLDTIEQALGSGDKPGNADASGTAVDAAKTEASPTNELSPEMTWKRMEISVMLERVQAHIAPTDVDPGAGIQWLPKISKKHAKVKRTGVLLERVFTPCDMYFQFTRHNGWTTDLKMKPLKELAFNSHDITASMTSRQFQVMMDVLTNLLFARVPKRRRNSMTYPVDDDENGEEEADQVVPYGVEEVELAKIKVEEREREQILLLDDIRKLSHYCDTGDSYREEGDLWMITSGKSALVQGLKKELPNVQKSRKEASSELRTALRKAAQQRLMEKEKNKGPSCAMRVSLKITKIVWDMLLDGKPFAGAEINDMICDYDRDYRDVGIVLLTTKSITFKNCLPNAKSDTLLSAWNPPAEWGKKVMVRVDAKQGPPKEGYSVLELLQVEIYPLKIHLTETMYRMMWSYLFATEDQDSQRRQEVWKVSTTAGSKRAKKGQDSSTSGRTTKDSEAASKPQSASFLSNPLQALKLQNIKPNIVSGPAPDLRRSSSFDRSWEETVAESVATELVLQAAADQADDSSKRKDSKSVKSGQSSQEDKKLGKTGDQEKKQPRPQKLMEFHNIKISQVELCVTYEGSRFVVSDLKLLMDTFHRDEFMGTWRRLFSRVKKHIIWGVLKSVTGMQGAKFKDKSGNSKEAIAAAVAENELNLSDNEGGPTEKSDQLPVVFPKRQGGDMAGDGFVTSVRGLFNTQRKKAKKFVLRTMRGEENEIERSESDVEVSPFARQLTITKAKKLIRRHTKKFDTKGHKGSPKQSEELLPSSPMAGGFESDSSSDSSSPFSDIQEGSLNNNSG